MKNLPCPITKPQAALATTAASYARIEKYVRRLTQLERSLHVYAGPGTCCWSSRELALAKQMLAEREAMRSDWAVLSQPASTEQIGISTSYLVTSFFNLPKSERENITRILCVEIGGEEPSLYMLASMVRSVSHSCEFLSVATVVKNLSQARRAERRCEQVLTNSGQLEEYIEHAEKLLPLIAKQESEDEAKRRKRLRQRAKEFPPEIFAYTLDDLELLGRRGDK